MNEQVFKPIENYVNDFKNHFINTFTSGELSKYMDKENIQIFNTNPFETDKDIITKQVYFIEDNLNTYYNNKMDISYFVNENMYNSIFNLDIMNNGIYLSHSLEG